MPVRTQTPGLIAKKRKTGPDRLYWSADKITPKAVNYPERLIPLPSDASDAELIDLCEAYTARLKLWLTRGPAPRFVYDGTIGSLCDCYERHPESPMQEVRRATAGGYADSLKVLRATVAARAVRAITPIEVKRMYRNWREPKVAGGTERVKRAHDAVSMLRAILKFGLAMGHEECARLSVGLSAMQFERSAPRGGFMTIAHVKAFTETALARGDLRGLYMAIGVATQFETMLRQRDVIGEWSRDKTGRESWSGLYRWDNIPAGILRVHTSKSNGKKEVVHDLPTLGLLWPLIQQVPQHEREGAIIKAYGEPIRERSYRKWYREIANAAGIPKDVWNMDARAGAVTEALEAGAPMAQVQRTATHSTPIMTSRYDRTAETAPAAVAAARRNARSRT